MRLAGLLLIAILPACALAPHHSSPPPEFDHYRPAALNEAAIQALRHGETGTALILLERALRLVPGDEEIQCNLQEVKEELAGRPLAPPPEPAPAPAPAERPRPGPPLPPPPPLWPPGETISDEGGS